MRCYNHYVTRPALSAWPLMRARRPLGETKALALLEWSGVLTQRTVPRCKDSMTPSRIRPTMPILSQSSPMDDVILLIMRALLGKYLTMVIENVSLWIPALTLDSLGTPLRLLPKVQVVKTCHHSLRDVPPDFRRTAPQALFGTEIETIVFL